MTLDYCNQHVDNSTGYVHSIDKIRLKFKLHKEMADMFARWAVADTMFCSVEHWTKPSGVYHDTMKYSTKSDVSWAAGLGLQTPTVRDPLSGWLEFNPNKCYGLDGFEKWMNTFMSFCRDSEIKRVDYAVDMPIDRCTMRLCKGDSRTYQLWDEGGSVTEYAGKRGDGYVKLYDKQRESALERPLTRCEVTLELGKGMRLPAAPVAVYEGLEGLEGSMKLIAMLLAEKVRRGEPIEEELRLLNRRTQKKIRDAATSRIIQPFDWVLLAKLIYSYDYLNTGKMQRQAELVCGESLGLA